MQIIIPVPGTRLGKGTLAAAGALVLFVAVGASSCGGGNSSGQTLEQNASASIEKTFVQNQPVPIFSHSDIRQTAIAIEAIQALGENTTSFAFNMGEKNPIWSCPSLGEPVAADTQITNPQIPENATDGNGNYNTIPVSNMDPNGIYAGPSTGTYVLCVSKTGTPYAHYWEGFVDVVSGPATWDAGTGQVVVSGAPTMPSCSVQTVQGKHQTVCVK
jgi:hypothetical protein